MVLSLQSRAIHERNRGVILRLARESAFEMQEACQFTADIKAQEDFVHAQAENPANKSDFLNLLRHNVGTLDSAGAFSSARRLEKRCDDFKFITFSASYVPIF
jgi:hypothetical protein